MTKKTAQILVAGPAVVSRAFGKDFTKEELGGSDIHKINGVVDNVAENEMDAFEQIKSFFRLCHKIFTKLQIEKITMIQ